MKFGKFGTCFIFGAPLYPVEGLTGRMLSIFGLGDLVAAR